MDVQDSNLHGGQLAALGSMRDENKMWKLTLSMLRAHADKFTVIPIRQFQNDTLPISQLSVAAFPEIDRVMVRIEFYGPVAILRVLDFQGNLLRETGTTRLPQGLRFYPDRLTKSFAVTYINSTLSSLSTLCFARFDLVGMKVITNVEGPVPRCYGPVKPDAIAYSADNAGFFIQSGTNLYFVSIDNPNPLRQLQPVMTGVPVKWPGELARMSSVRLAVVQG